MKTYQLVNPFIVGKMNTLISADSYNEAGKEAWNMLSENVKLYTDKFLFSLMDLSQSKLYHFMVQEKANDSGEINYNLKNIKGGSGDKYDKIDKLFTKKVELLQNNTGKTKNKKNKQKGGDRRRRYSELSGDFDSDFYDELDMLEDIFADDELYNLALNRSNVRRNNLVPRSDPFYWIYYNPYVYTPFVDTVITFPTFVYPHVVKIDLSSATNRFFFTP